MAFKFKLTRTKRLSIAIGISLIFFIAEITTGFYTHSLALIADAFHYLNDLIGFVIALVAVVISEKNDKKTKSLTFGFQRAQLLGSFFNGVFLLALGVSIFLQSIERFVTLQKVDNPFLVMIIGCVGFALNAISALFLHEHDHGPEALEDLATSADDGVLSGSAGATQMQPISSHHEHRHNSAGSSKHKHSHDLGMAAVLLHVLGDALNNIGVIVAGAVIWKMHYAARYYADPGVGIGISLMILLSSVPLVRKSGAILLQSPPAGVDVNDVKHDLEAIPGVLSVHELHVWRLNQHKAIATGHIVIADPDLAHFEEQARTINQCLHAYGVHSATLQPELAVARSIGSTSRDSLLGADPGVLARRIAHACSLNCGSSCELLSCCG